MSWSSCGQALLSRVGSEHRSQVPYSERGRTGSTGVTIQWVVSLTVYAAHIRCSESLTPTLVGLLVRLGPQSGLRPSVRRLRTILLTRNVTILVDSPHGIHETLSRLGIQ